VNIPKGKLLEKRYGNSTKKVGGTPKFIDTWRIMDLR